ncbi:MAG: hypothetical protein JWQ20_3267, partial [Conexibacter sp.]|nr:hypothetical protein [Conexibacter sp.]
RDGSAPDAHLADAARAGGAEVTVGSGDGWGDMLDEPGRSRAPWASVRVIDAWLDAAPAGPARPRDDAAPPAAAASALFAGGAVREQPLHIDGVDGVLSEPAADGPAPFTLVLVNAGSVRRIGPNRMWVELARRWAARGVPSVRLDLAGIGEAEGPESMEGQDARYYEGVFSTQISAVIDALQERGAAGRFAPLGLCSGAYWALHAAADDPRVETAYLLNARALVWDRALTVERDSRKLSYLTRASTYRRVLRGDIPLSRGLEIARALAQKARAKVRPAAPADAATRVGAADPVDALLDRLRDAGKEPYLLFTGGEPVHEELARSGRLAAQPERWPNLRIDELTEFRDVHTFQTVGLQRRAHALVDAAIARDVARARAALSR